MYGLVDRLTRVFAFLGGAVLSLLIVMTCLSVLGRSLNSLLYGDFLQTAAPGLANALLATGVGPINGDFELLEAGMAFAIFAFLPLCQLKGAHASVDIFASFLPARINAGLRVGTEVVFACVLVLIAWQLFEGLLSKRASGQTTFLLQFPVWWAYAASLAGAVMAAAVAIYVAVARSIEVATGRRVLPAQAGAEVEP